MFITIFIIFVLSIYYLTLFHNEQVDDDLERQALIASIEKSKSRFRQPNRKIKSTGMAIKGEIPLELIIKRRLTKSLKKNNR